MSADAARQSDYEKSGAQKTVAEGASNNSNLGVEAKSCRRCWETEFALQELQKYGFKIKRFIFMQENSLCEEFTAEDTQAKSEALFGELQKEPEELEE